MINKCNDNPNVEENSNVRHPKCRIICLVISMLISYLSKTAECRVATGSRQMETSTKSVIAGVSCVCQDVKHSDYRCRLSDITWIIFQSCGHGDE